MKDDAHIPFDIEATVAALAAGEPVVFEGIDVVTADVYGRRMRFASDRPKDPIQRKHRKGMFYERAEIEQIKAHFPYGGTFADIGANIGNHSLFVAAFMTPARVIPFEPNPEACKLLLANIAMNGLEGVFDLSHLGAGVGSTEGDGFGVKGTARNLGGGTLTEGAGDIRILRGDSVLSQQRVDMIKVDVEGMEMEVLGGLGRTFRRARPMLMIEVDDRNAEAFAGWQAKMGYEVVDETRRYENNTNFLLRAGGAE